MDGPLGRIGEVREVFDLTTSDGRHVQMFAAENEAGGLCSAVTLDLDADTEPGDFGYGCAAGDYTENDGVGIVSTDSDNPGPPILFGNDFGGFQVPTDAVAVRVDGPAVHRKVELDPDGRWALELPRSQGPDHYQITFIDSDGRTLLEVTQVVRSDR